MRQFFMIALVIVSQIPSFKLAFGADYPVVHDFVGSPKNYQVERNGELIPVVFEMRLYEGDQIVVNKPDGYIRVDYGPNEGDQETICASDAPEPRCTVRGLYTVTTSKKLSTSSVLLHEIFTYLTELVEPPRPERADVHGKEYRQPSGAYAKIQVPFGNSTETLVAGERDLAISWEGGAPPFRVYIFRSGDGRSLARVFAAESVTEPIDRITPDDTHEAVAHLRDLSPGDYLLKVADAHSSFDGGFKVVPGSELPAFPAELEDPDLPAEVRRTAEAAWLWKEAGFKWRWEAYIRVAAAGNAYAPAKAVREALERGESFPGDSKTITPKRVALVIGNGNYPHGPLRHPAADARDMAKVLKQSGFEVMPPLLDANAAQMDQARQAFKARILPGDVALFYFSGHGMQIDGENYLLPVDTEGDENAVKWHSLPANEVLESAHEARAGVNIMILDACRNNPVSRATSGSTGLARMTAPGQSLIAFATAPNHTAYDNDDEGEPNSVFTKYLLRYLQQPGLTLPDVLMGTAKEVTSHTNNMQWPQYFASLTEKFYLIPPISAVNAEPAKHDGRPASAEKYAREGDNALHSKYGADYAEAERNYRKAVELEPDFSQYRIGLASALYYQEKYSDAEVEARKAIELAPGQASAHNTLGEIFEAERKYVAAEAEYKTALKLDPKLRDANQNVERLQAQALGEVLTNVKLGRGLGMGVDTSEGRHDWVKPTEQNDALMLTYPGGRWGAVFVTVGKPMDRDRPSQDYSAFGTLEIEMRGENGDEALDIGVKDSTQPDDGTEAKVPVMLTRAWQRYQIAVSKFSGADLRRLYVVCEFVFGAKPETVYVRQIRYLK